MSILQNRHVQCVTLIKQVKLGPGRTMDTDVILLRSLQFSGERANFMAPAWPRPLTFVRPFDIFLSLRPLE